jgi:hypothetical protein
MQPEAVSGYSVKARCPDCGAVSMFDHKHPGGDYGSLLTDGSHPFKNSQYARIHWRLLRCSGCSRAGLAKFHDNGNAQSAVLESFHPRALASAGLPTAVPDGIAREYREAELCASVEAWRAASALLRSTLEKTLKANGYTKGSLQQKIDDAANDGIITSARRQKAHDDIRVLGNEVVHDDWRPVDEGEVQAALHYAQRILEDFYDDRPAAEAVLKVKGRL